MELNAPLLWIQPAPNANAASGTRPAAPSPYAPVSQAAVLADLALIQADKIAVAGEVTFADWHRDINGAATGVIDPSITQIRGGVIRTERVLSFDGESYLDLDAVGANPFLKSRTNVVVNADGTFTLGGSGTKTLSFDGTDLKLGATSLIASSAATYAANVFVKSTLEEAAQAITLNSASLFSKMSGLAGVKIGSGGLFGTDSSGNPTFTLDASTGQVTAIDISAATGTFSGDIVTAGQISASGSTSSTPGIYASIVGYASTANSGTAALFGYVPVGAGVGPGLVIDCANGSSGTGIAVFSAGTGFGLSISGKGILLNGGQLVSLVGTGTAPFTVESTTNVANLNASSLNGATFAAPGAIGGTTPSSGAFTTLSATGQITSTLAAGTAPVVLASTTLVTNLFANYAFELYNAGKWFYLHATQDGTKPGGATVDRYLRLVTSDGDAYVHCYVS